MTTPDPAQGRPVPDTDDLRLLAEIINNGAIGLPQAAWNARMSQSEAAARLVTMAERGMPLRLVAEGDREMLWRIAQAGPATSGFALPPDAAGAAVPVEPVVPPEPAPVPPPAMPVQPMEPPPVQQLPVTRTPPAPPESGPVQPAQMPTGPVLLPPASAVPPHEQAIAGAVPLGQPPFGTPPAVDTGSQEIAAAEPEREREPEPEMTQYYPPPGESDGDGQDAGEPQPAAEPDPAEPEPAAEPEPEPSASSPSHRVMTYGQPTQSVTGLFGEHLDVSLQQIIDPADQILTSVGYRLDPSERSLLVQTSIGNRGPADYESLPDLYLALRGSTGVILEKAAMAVGGYPAHRVGVPAGSLVSGWTVFRVPAATEVSEVLWSIRPDLPDRTVIWGFGPA